MSEGCKNWIDILWKNPRDTEAENALRKLWLEFQADRKRAWDELRLLAISSEEIRERTGPQVRAVLLSAGHVYDLQLESEPQILEAMDEIENVLRSVRATIPAHDIQGLLRYLKDKAPETGRFHHVDRWVRRYFRDQPRAGGREQEMEAPDS